MKRIIYLLAFAGVLLTACEKDQPGGTATQALAGEWVVRVDGVDASGNVVVKDPNAVNRMMFYTYNTAANVSTEMFVDDRGGFIDMNFKARVKSDVDALTFSTSGAVTNEAAKSGNVTISDGRVILNGATTAHGTRVDSIVFFLNIDGDTGAYAKLRVAGSRYTGLAEDEFDL
jgi:hypothetical protein